jgi:hypothetical protein
MNEYQELKAKYLTRKKIKRDSNAAVNISQMESSPEGSRSEKAESF